jgi:glycosyltransferase involved in cell wall biosynthesis
MVKVFYFSPHPIQYNIGIFRELEKLNSIDFKVIFEDNIGLNLVFVKEFSTVVKWDINLLEGYKYKFLNNISFNSMGGFFSRINPSVIKLIFTEKPDVIILHGYANLSDWMVFFTSKILGIKIIFRGEAVIKENEKLFHWKQKLKIFILPKFLKACDVVMYSCSGNKKYWEFYGVKESKLFSIPCAVDNDFFKEEGGNFLNKKNEIRKELGVDIDDLIILFSARFTKRKRPLDLLKAVSKIENYNITVLFVGDGPERVNMENLAKENNIKAVFTGFINQSEISKYYAISDVDIVISDYDPSPKSMNEAMNFELPIIVTDVVGTATDLVKDGKNGYIVKVGDIDTLAKKIDYLNDNRNMANNMGKKSLEIVSEWTFKKDAYYINKAIKYIMKGATNE